VRTDKQETGFERKNGFTSFIVRNSIVRVADASEASSRFPLKAQSLVGTESDLRGRLNYTCDLSPRTTDLLFTSPSAVTRSRTIE